MDEQLRKKQCLGFLNTPPLWHNEQFNIPQFKFPKIDLDEFELQPIPTKIRLGHQMEHVFMQLIEHDSNYRLLLHNLPIKRGKQTIGEIDFILEQIGTSQLIHVELTYKFYIIEPNISEPVHQLMGPNKRDMFFTKMEKIRSGQFQLLHSPEGILALSDAQIDHTKINHQACYKAQLFEPYGSSYNKIRPLNITCIVGYWLYMDDFHNRDFKKWHYYIPYKSEWVIAPHRDVPWRSHFKTLMEVNLRLIKENAPMVWVQKSETEFEKFFVVWWK